MWGSPSEGGVGIHKHRPSQIRVGKESADHLESMILIFLFSAEEKSGSDHSTNSLLTERL